MEHWDLYDRDKVLTGKTMERGSDLLEGHYHLVVGIWSVTDDGRILITQRHPDKDCGLMWECSGGGVLAGESSLEGAIRELGEEVGIKAEAEELTFLGTILTERFFVDSYLYRGDIRLEDLTLQAKEVIDAKLVTLEEFEEMHKEGLIVEAMVEEFKAYQAQILAHLK